MVRKSVDRYRSTSNPGSTEHRSTSRPGSVTSHQFRRASGRSVKMTWMVFRDGGIGVGLILRRSSPKPRPPNQPPSRIGRKGDILSCTKGTFPCCGNTVTLFVLDTLEERE